MKCQPVTALVINNAVEHYIYRGVINVFSKKVAGFHGQALNEMNFFLTKTNQAGKMSLSAQFATPVNIIGPYNIMA